MIPDNAALTVTDVLNYHQKRGHFKVPARSFSAISLRLNTTGKYLCGGKTIAFQPPCLCLIPTGVAYERFSLDDDILVIHFDMPGTVMEAIEVYQISDSEKYRKLFVEALRLRLENAAGARFMETAVLYKIIGELQRETSNNQSSGGSIAETANYMQRHFWDPSLTVDHLAKRANVSSAQYRRKFRQIYAQSPKQYLDTLRFGYAKSLLETGYFSQTEVAFRCGFSSVEYFRTAFKKETGQCVKAYCKLASE